MDIGFLRRGLLSCDLLTITENSQSAPLELQCSVMHLGTEAAQHAGKFHVLNKSSQIHSVFTVISPGHH